MGSGVHTDDVSWVLVGNLESFDRLDNLARMLLGLFGDVGVLDCSLVTAFFWISCRRDCIRRGGRKPMTFELGETVEDIVTILGLGV
jgi:hypothetical protein